MEADSPGGPSQTQRDRAIGAYELRIETVPATDAAWRLLRRSLRFSRADDAWLRARVPGVVRRGALVDLLALKDRVLEAGQQASVVKRSVT